mmetsp:Transcript_8717/g.23714  ORF Transcript_8717/g.23714 Transcript_8717/m.23714 type:complete len:211 (+) Transcript_8717:233-865(+)
MQRFCTSGSTCLPVATRSAVPDRLGLRRVGLTPCRARRTSASSEADLYDPRVGIDAYQVEDATLLDTALAQPVYVKVPAAFLGVLVVTRVLGTLMRRQRRSALEERGYKRDSAADEDHYSRMMKGMKTVKYEELSDEALQAARKRRQREVAGDSLDFDNLDLPANHPFAVKQEVSKEEEEMQRQRLMARRGLSAQDLELLRKTQEEADQM